MPESTQPPEVTPLERQWPLALLGTVILALGGAYLAVLEAVEKPARGFAALSLGVLPNLVASGVIALTLLVLLRRDFRRPTGGDLALTLNEATLDEIGRRVTSTLPSVPVVVGRGQLSDLRSFATGARTMSVAAVSGLGLINHHRALFEEKLREGMKLRVLLLNPLQSDSLDVWDRLSNPPMPHPESDIRSGIRQYVALASVQGLAGKCEVLLTNDLLPFSLIAVEGPNEASVQVELHAYRRAPEERACVVITSEASPHWHNFFSSQFDAAWNEARPPAADLQ